MLERPPLTIGLIGGMSAESTALYYTLMHEAWRARTGGIDYPTIVVYSVPFGDCVRWTEQGDWAEAATQLAEAARRLAAAGADFALMATNTMHKVFDEVAAASPIPLLDVVACVAEDARDQGIETVGLLGTATTMGQAFYRDRLARYGVKALVPDTPAQARLSEIIYTELTAGLITEPSQAAYVKAAEDLAARGAGGIILGCTEIPLILTPKVTGLPLLDTARLHALAALDVAMHEKGV